MLRRLWRNFIKPSFSKNASNLALLRCLHKSKPKSETRKPQAKPKDQDDISSFTVSYLINSCGLSPQSALPVSKKIITKFQSSEAPDSILSFFRSNGFTDVQIAIIIEKLPVLLSSNLEATIKPKFDLLTSILGSNQQAAALAVRRNPCILQRDLHTHFLPNFVTLQSIGAPLPIIIKLITFYPRVMLLSTKLFNSATEKIKEMGFDPRSTMFAYGVAAMAGIKPSTWEKKLGIFKSLGWSEEETVFAFTRHPFLMLKSEEKIRQGMDFFVNEMGWGPSFLSRRPALFLYSLGKRIIPRHSVMSVLVSKGLWRGDRAGNYRVFAMSEKDFLNKYVIKFHDQVPELLKLYKRKLQERTVDTSKQ